MRNKENNLTEKLSTYLEFRKKNLINNIENLDSGLSKGSQSDIYDKGRLNGQLQEIKNMIKLIEIQKTHGNT